VIEYLLSKCKALGSNITTTKKKKNKTEERMYNDVLAILVQFTSHSLPFFFFLQ
jgi:hypothetical protein